MYLQEGVAAGLVAIETVDVAEIGSVVSDRKHLRFRASFDLAAGGAAHREVEVDEVGVLLVSGES